MCDARPLTPVLPCKRTGQVTVKKEELGMSAGGKAARRHPQTPTLGKPSLLLQGTIKIVRGTVISEFIFPMVAAECRS